MKYALLVNIFLFSLSAFSALPNESRTVGKIDIMKDTLVVWLDGEMFGQNEACNTYRAISCSIEDEHCKIIFSTALAAKLSLLTVEFSFSNLCNGSFADVQRFRLMNE